MICLMRIEAYPVIGTGHFVRCKIIANYLSARGIDCLFLVSLRSRNIVESSNVQFRIIDDTNELEEVLAIGNEFEVPKLVLTDSDNDIFYSKEYQEGLVKEGFFLATITMRNDCFFYSNIVLNQNIIALDQSYQNASYSKLLLGPEYVIFNDGFRNIDLSKKITNTTTSKPTVLLNFGGADRLNLTLSVYRQLMKISNQIGEINIVVGKLYGPIEELTQCINANSGILKSNLFINTNKMPELMLESDLAITSGGLTVWELLYLKIPNMVISTSERERITAEALSLRKCIVNMGHETVGENFLKEISYNLNNKEEFLESIEKSKIEIDGKGITRFYDAIVDLLKM